MMISTYLSFDGNCQDAFTYYADHLGGKIQALMRFSDGGPEMCAGLPEPMRDRVMHGSIEIAGHLLMASDATPDHPYTGIQGAHVAYQPDTVAEAERVFAALARGGKVHMPLQETFWAHAYGMLVDQFGVPWMVSCNKPMGC